MVLAIDFDGTCVKHEYPKVGADVPGAIRVLTKLSKKGHQLILWTMRSGKHLQDAVEWFEKNNIPLYGVQENPEQKSWTQSPKAYAQLYIDDAALGCPLVSGSSRYSYERPYVNWEAVEKWLEINNVI